MEGIAHSYRINDRFAVIAGFRYNNLSGAIRGPGILPSPRIPTGHQEWGDPIVGGDVRIPFAGDLSFDLRADIGGFDVGSRLTWQVFPRVNWHCSKRGFLQAGYRWLYTDYETGNGKGLFGFDMLTQRTAGGGNVQSLAAPSVTSPLKRARVITNAAGAFRARCKSPFAVVL
jgi:hypothetical protein